MFVGFLDDAGTAPSHKLVEQWKVALPLHPECEHGAERLLRAAAVARRRCARTARIDESQRRIPLAYLESLFGPDVGTALHTLEAEMAKRRRGQPSELMDTLIAYDWKDAARSVRSRSGDDHLVK